MNVTHGGGHRELAATLTREGVLKSWSWAHLQNSVGVSYRLSPGLSL